MAELTFKMTAATNVGLVRTNNEDNFIVNPDLTADNWFVPEDPEAPLTLGKDGCLLVVADGMGGMNAGEVASALAVESLRQSFSDLPAMTEGDAGTLIPTFLCHAIELADRKIKERVHEDPSTAGMGTTVVAVWVRDGIAHVAWCGDSRAYLFNKQSGLSRLSKDHSYVQQLVDKGELDPELAFYHPNSNIITRSLGDNPAKAQPEYISRKLSQGDVLLLCSDGLCGLCKDEEILEVLNAEDDESGSIEHCKNALIEAALTAGGHDNVTVALFQCLTLKENELTQTLVGKPKKKRRCCLFRRRNRD